MFSLLFVTCAIFVELFQGIFTLLNDKMNPDGAHFDPHIANIGPRYTNKDPKETFLGTNLYHLGAILGALVDHFSGSGEDP